MALEILDEESKYKTATTWLLGVVAGYKKQVEEMSKGPAQPDLNKVKLCRERQEVCQYIFDFMEKAKADHNKETASASVKPQNAVASIQADSVIKTIGKEQLERIELILGEESAITFCKAALILNMGSKDMLSSKIKGKLK